jgi:hypothetical protein
MSSDYNNTLDSDVYTYTGNYLSGSELFCEDAGYGISYVGSADNDKMNSFALYADESC